MRRSPRGFTLIELVVVLLIVGVAAAVLVPSIGRGSEALRARTQVSGFAAFLRHAREQAVTRREVHEVRIDPRARVVVLTGAGSDTPRLSRRLGEGWRIQASPPGALTVTFHPQGLSSGGSFRIEVAGGRVFVVTVDPLTGRVAQRRGDT